MSNLYSTISVPLWIHSMKSLDQVSFSAQLNSTTQASKNNKHTPITFTSSSVQPKRLIIKMAGFSHNQMAEKADTLKTMQNIKNLVGKSAEVIRMHIFGERWHPNFPFWARSPKRIFSNITFRREHITQIILHRISISHLSFCNFPFNSALVTFENPIQKRPIF